MRKETTIKDVAKYAGVSISTVSRVLNNLDRVSEKTRTQVLDAAERLNFVPNNIAVSMVRKSSRMIAVMIPDLVNTAYMSIVSGVEQTMRDAGYHTLLVSSDGKSEEELTMFTGTTGKFVDGAIVVPSCTNGEAYRAFRRPIVVVDRSRPEWGIDSVDVDNYGGIYTLTSHLLENGHRDIGILIGGAEFGTGIDRLQGYLDAMSAAGCPAAEGNIWRGDWFQSTGYEGVMHFLSREKRPTALVACNNLICMGAIQALYDQHISIPEDISLVGFDQNPLADFVRPRITVVRQPFVEMGAAAARRLIERLDHPEDGAVIRRTTLHVELVPGGSVKKLD